MTLGDLARQIPGATRLDAGDPRVTAVVCDSRQAAPGALFAAVPGARCDGHAYLEEAARRGAVACLVARAVPAFGMVRLRVDDVERALGHAASACADHPSRCLRVVGITGTNGKTTTAYLVQHLLGALGEPSGRLGTVSYAYPSGETPAPLTTPDAVTLQRALARMRAEGAAAVVMEVSSHALHRQRVEGTRFACTAFTNLTQDHLDYHGTMEHYFQAKRTLFTRYGADAPAVINAEDPYGARLLAELGGRAVSYGLTSGTVRLAVESLTPAALNGRLHVPGGDVAVRAPLAGAFNAYNVAAALAVVWALGGDVRAAAAALPRAPQVPGRVEAIPNPLGLAVFVDYAHTPDAIDRLLESLRSLAGGRLLCVFGCGGDRDRGKRPRMAEAAARWSDALVLTADNSRSEPTERILDEIEAGLPADWAPAACPAELATADRRYARQSDRARAIRWAVEAARPGDTVVIAGKGHETTQTLGDQVTRFDDRDAARAALAERSAA